VELVGLLTAGSQTVSSLVHYTQKSANISTAHQTVSTIHQTISTSTVHSPDQAKYGNNDKKFFALLSALVSLVAHSIKFTFKTLFSL
jgi:hypothetical protein